jgi:hypothetical protein
MMPLNHFQMLQDSLPFRKRVGVDKLSDKLDESEDSLPFKGRVRVGMGLKCRKSSLLIHPIPLPPSPLKGEEHPVGTLSKNSTEAYKIMVRLISSFSMTLPILMTLGWSTVTWGATLFDPTRPPQIWLEANGIMLATSNQEAPSGVQLIKIGPTKKFALVNGQVVMPGKALNGSKVLDITSDRVVTQDASKSLKLIPSVSKKNVTSAPPKKSRGKEQQNKKSANESGGNQ